MDNYATHKTPEVKAWLGAHPRFHVHFTPTSGSWLNLVEVWFGIIDRQAIRRGVFTSVKDLNAKIRAFITGWNNRKPPSSGPKPRRNPQESQPSTNFRRETLDSRHEDAESPCTGRWILALIAMTACGSEYLGVDSRVQPPVLCLPRPPRHR